MGKRNTISSPAGYLFLTKYYSLKVIENWHTSSIGATDRHEKTINELEGTVHEQYSRKRNPGDSPYDHLEFALKYDGVNLSILTETFQRLDENELCEFIKAKPTSQSRRRLWFLYEWYTKKRLPLDDLSSQSYIPVLNPEDYFTLSRPIRVSRQKVIDNLLGESNFCPIVRRTELLNQAQGVNQEQNIKELLEAYDPQIRYRAMTYLYLKETKSSFQIEREPENQNRQSRFVALLGNAENKDFCNKESLIELQGLTVDPRFAAADYRTISNYVGSVGFSDAEKIFYIPPKPEDLPRLMVGLIRAHRRMLRGETVPLIHAAAIAWGFVYLHPFIDGNGRVHRFLIHNVFAQRKYTPQGFIFPVSAAMLKNRALYDQSLDAFSVPLMALLDYSFEGNNNIAVENESEYLYRYIDFTRQAEILAQFVENTIQVELVAELNFLSYYERTKRALQEVVDLPDQKLDLFMRSLDQNNGKLGEKKRRQNFEFLTDEEIQEMENVFAQNWKVIPEPKRKLPAAETFDEGTL